MDGRNALSGFASNGKEWLDQITLGGIRERTETKILRSAKGWQGGLERTTHTMDESSRCPCSTLGGEICLSSTKKSPSGGGRWLRVELIQTRCSMSWRAI